MTSSKMGRNPFGQKKSQADAATEAPKARAKETASKKKNASTPANDSPEKTETSESRSAGISARQAAQALIGAVLDQVTVSLPIGLVSVAAEAGKRALSLVRPAASSKRKQ